MDASGTDISLCVYLLLSEGCGHVLWVSLCVCLCVLMYVFLDAVGGYRQCARHSMRIICVCMCVFSFAISVCLGLKAPVSEGVSGGHLNRICSRIA